MEKNKTTKPVKPTKKYAPPRTSKRGVACVAQWDGARKAWIGAPHIGSVMERAREIANEHTAAELVEALDVEAVRALEGTAATPAYHFAACIYALRYYDEPVRPGQRGVWVIPIADEAAARASGLAIGPGLAMPRRRENAVAIITNDVIL